MARRLDTPLARIAQADPQCAIAWDRGVAFTYGEIDALVARAAGFLWDRGVRKGDRVGFLGNPSITYLVTLFAVSRIGAIYVGLNPKYTKAELAHVQRVVTPKFTIVDTSEEGAARVSLMQSATGDAREYHAVARPEDFAQCDPAPEADCAETDPAVIVFTSGSTGAPKAAVLHHEGILAAAEMQADALARHLPADAPQRTYLSNLPINHVGGIINLTMACIVAGGRLVFEQKFDPAQTLELIDAQSITNWLQVPTMFTICVNAPAFDPARLACVDTVAIGGGAVSAPTLAKLRQVGAGIAVEYGMTELMSTVTLTDAMASDDAVLNTVGRFGDRVEARIVHDDLRPIAVGEVGEVQARGNCTLRGYFGDPDATRAAMTSDGWFRTGDLATQRDDGSVEIRGRLREMIKSGGYNVYPREVEAALEKHPAVAEAVVFGCPDEVLSERVEAAIELRRGQPVPEYAELKAALGENLTGYKIPKAIHVRPILPRLANGKIDRTAVASDHRQTTPE